MKDLVVPLLLTVLAFILGIASGQRMLRQQAINHNAAHYDAKTGAFTWNEPESKEKQP